MSATRTIFFVGKPGCGKGTQSKLLASHTGWPMFASGKLFREIAEQDTPLGRQVKEEVNVQGLLGPPWLAMYFYLKCLFTISNEQSAIFDGFNRKVYETELIVDSLRWFQRSFSVVHINISDDEVKKRIELRRQTSGRLDDQTVEQRLEEYEKYTKDAIAIFEKAGVLIEIDGEQTPEKIAEDIRAALQL